MCDFQFNLTSNTVLQLTAKYLSTCQIFCSFISVPKFFWLDNKEYFFFARAESKKKKQLKLV